MGRAFVIGDPLAVFVVLAAVVFISIWLETHVKAAKILGSVLLAIVGAAVLSNIGVLPSSSPTYDYLGGVGVNIGIALILLGVDVRSVVSAGPRMLGAFTLGAVGTVVGALIGAALLSGAIGPETWKLAGQYTGTYIGGGVNMVAVGRGLETDPDVFGAAIAADNVTTAVWMIVCFGLPGVVGRWWDTSAQRPARATVGDSLKSESHPPPIQTSKVQTHSFISSERIVHLPDAAALVLLAGFAVLASRLIANVVPQIPQVLWLTSIVLIAAQLKPIRDLSGGPLWGNYILHLFLAGIGAQSILAEIARVGPAILYFTLVVVGVHGLFLFGLGRLVRLDLPTLAVASQANVGGPASAMALATARGYGDRLLPGIAVGLLGYAVGNYAGFAVAHFVRTWLT